MPAQIVNGINAAIGFDAAGGTSFADVSTTNGWSASIIRAAASTTPSNNGGGQIQTAGTRDWNGSFNFLGSDIPMYPGATGTFLGYNGHRSVQAHIIAETATFNWDVAGSGNMGGTVGWQGSVKQADGTGAWDYVSTTETDSSDPAVYNSVGILRVDWKPVGQADYATLTGIESASLTISRSLALAYISEYAPNPIRTAGSYTGSGVIRMRDAEWTYLEATANLLAPGTFGYLRLYTAAAAYFDIAFAMIGENRPATSPDDNAVVEIPWTLSLGTRISGSWTDGYFGKPSGGTWFGTVP